MPGYRMLMRVAVLKMQWAMMGVQMLPVYSYSSTSTAPKIARGMNGTRLTWMMPKRREVVIRANQTPMYFFMIGYR